MQPSALEIHDWISKVIGISDDSIHTMQLDADQYCVFVKLFDPVMLDKIIAKFGRSVDFVHRDGTQSKVSIRRADANYINVRVLNLPIEIDNVKIKDVLSKYGEVRDIVNEKWSKQFKLQCFNGVRAVEMDVKVNIPSYVTVEGYKAHVIYTGQTPTCHICNESGHFRQDCPRRAFVLKNNLTQRHKLTLSEVLGSDTAPQQGAGVSPVPPASEQITGDLSAFPPLTARSNTDPVSRDTDIQNKKRPIELLEDHSDEEASRKTPAIRKQKPCDEVLQDTHEMLVDVGKDTEIPQSVNESDTSIAFQPTLSSEISHEPQLKTNENLTEIAPKHLSAEASQQVPITVTQEEVFCHQHVDTQTLPAAAPRAAAGHKQKPVCNQQPAVAAAAPSAKPKTSTPSQEGPRRKLKPQPNLTTCRTQPKMKAEKQDKQPKNQKYEIILEGSDEDPPDVSTNAPPSENSD